MVANVSPGTPATANRPFTRSGWWTASSNIVLTPIDQPISTAWSMPKWSITESPSCTKCSISTCEGSAGPVGAAGAAVVPRDHADTAVGVEQRRPGVGVGAEAVAQHHRRPVDHARRGRWSRPAGGCRRRTGCRGNRARRSCQRRGPRRWTCLDSARARHAGQVTDRGYVGARPRRVRRSAGRQSGRRSSPPPPGVRRGAGRRRWPRSWRCGGPAPGRSGARSGGRG